MYLKSVVNLLHKQKEKKIIVRATNVVVEVKDNSDCSLGCSFMENSRRCGDFDTLIEFYIRNGMGIRKSEIMKWMEEYSGEEDVGYLKKCVQLYLLNAKVRKKKVPPKVVVQLLEKVAISKMYMMVPCALDVSSFYHYFEKCIRLRWEKDIPEVVRELVITFFDHQEIIEQKTKRNNVAHVMEETPKVMMPLSEIVLCRQESNVKKLPKVYEMNAGVKRNNVSMQHQSPIRKFKKCIEKQSPQYKWKNACTKTVLATPEKRRKSMPAVVSAKKRACILMSPPRLVKKKKD